MARPMTVIEFDDEEKETLKSVYDTRRFNAIVKPIAETLRDKAESIKAIGAAHNVRSEDVAAAKEQLEEFQRLLEGLPGSDSRDEAMQGIDAAKEVLEEALALG